MEFAQALAVGWFAVNNAAAAVEKPHKVRVDWAVESKRPGAPMGYTLLAGSVDRARAERLIEAATTGTPAGENAGRIDALPWMSFTADPAGPTPLLGVVDRSWSGEHDVTGQPIMPRRLLTVDWSSTTAALPGFAGLLALARSVRWTGVDGPPEGVHGAQPVVGTVPPLSVDRLVMAIDDLGFDWALAAAVALLDGDQVVVVTPGQVFSLQQRVQVLDAVCALLPYGCRAWISAATWAQHRSAHTVRLSFAERGRPGQWVIDFDELRPATPRTPEATAYLAEMTLLRSEGFPTARIVEHLAVLHELLGPHEAGRAVEHLRELRLVASTVEDINNGRGDPERVEAVLTRFGWRSLTPAQRQAVASFLVGTAVRSSGPSAAARLALRRHWAPELVQYLADEITAQRGDADRLRQRMSLLDELGRTIRDPVLAVLLDVALARHAVRQFFNVAWAYVLKVAYQPDARGGHRYLKNIAQQVAEGSTALGPEATAAAQLLALGAAKTPRLEIGADWDLAPLAAAWRALPPEGRATLGRRLPAAVLGKEMTATSFRALAEVSHALDPVDQRGSDASGLWDHAAAEVGERLVRHPDLLPTLALDEQWAGELVRYTPQYAWLTEWFTVQRAASTPETDMTAIRDAYARLRSSGAPATAAVRAIAPWLQARGPEGLDQLLHASGEQTGDRASLADEIRSGTFAEPALRDLGVAYQRFVRERLRELLALAQYYQQQETANDDVTRRLGIPLPRSTAARPVPSDGARAESTGALRRVMSILRGDPDA